jgi:hypothetical protein
MLPFILLLSDATGPHELDFRLDSTLAFIFTVLEVPGLLLAELLLSWVQER